MNLKKIKISTDNFKEILTNNNIEFEEIIENSTEYFQFYNSWLTLNHIKKREADDFSGPFDYLIIKRNNVLWEDSAKETLSKIEITNLYFLGFRSPRENHPKYLLILKKINKPTLEMLEMLIDNFWYVFLYSKKYNITLFISHEYEKGIITY